jgi:hypothetical protein
MKEKVVTHALSREGRRPYGAVPLNPWRATHVPDVKDWHNLYVNGSNTRIERRLTQAMVDGEWFKREPRAHQLYEFMRVSLIDSQNRRIEMNGRPGRVDDLSRDDERVVRALDGTALPAELFTLLADNPELGSLELAKLSHPFDFDASNEMDREIDGLLLDLDGELLDDEPRYKIKRTDLSIPAAMLLRKQDLMDFRLDDDWVVRVIQRRGLMVFDGNGIDDPYFDRLIKNPKNHAALFAMTENVATGPDQRESFGWVQPQATSYYAKVIFKDNRRPI